MLICFYEWHHSKLILLKSSIYTFPWHKVLECTIGEMIASINNLTKELKIEKKQNNTIQGSHDTCIPKYTLKVFGIGKSFSMCVKQIHHSSTEYINDYFFLPIYLVFLPLTFPVFLYTKPMMELKIKIMESCQ